MPVTAEHPPLLRAPGGQHHQRAVLRQRDTRPLEVALDAMLDRIAALAETARTEAA